MKNYKRLALISMLAVLFSLMLASPALAWQVRYPIEHNRQNTMVVDKNEVVSEDMLIAGNNVIIDGTVNGDLVVFANSVIINGTVSGDLISLSQDLTVNGVINHDVRAAAQYINIKGKVNGNITQAGNRISLEQGSTVGGNVLLAGEKVEVQSAIAGMLTSHGKTTDIAGRVGRDTVVRAEQVTIGSAADIGGQLRYTSRNKAIIEPGSKIAGGVTHKLPPQPEAKPAAKPSPWDGVVWFIVSAAASLLVWYVWRLLFPGSFDQMREAIKTAPGPALGYGLLLLIVVPIAALLLLATVVGIPLSILAMTFYIALIFLAKIPVGYWLGEVIVDKIDKPGFHHPLSIAAIGIILLSLVAAIPVLGFFVKLLVALAGLGGAYLAIRNSRTVKPDDI